MKAKPSKPRPALGLPENGTAAEWEAVRARLEADREAAERELGEARARGRELALAAAAGDPGALRGTEAANGRAVAAMRRLDLLGVADGEAAEALAEARGREAAAEARAKLERLRGRAEVAERAAAAVDAAAGKLFEALDDYRVAVSATIPDGLDGARVNKLRNRTKMLGAMQAAGLGQHLVLDRVPASHQETLQSWTRRMLRDLLEPAGAPEAGEGIAA